MIYTITINPALDINIDCDETIRPTTIRTKQERRHAGGKGIDVSRVVRNLGGTSVAMGFLGGFTGESIEGLLLEEGLELDFVSIAEETRTNVIITAPIDNKKKDHRFNSQGPKVQPVESSKLFTKIKNLSTVHPDRRPTHAAICGSLARDMKPQYYVNIVRHFKNLGAKIWMDTSGSAIKESLRYPPRPDFVKPNLIEFAELLEGKLTTAFADRRRPVESSEEFLERLLQEENCQGSGDFWPHLFQETKGFSTYPGVSGLIVTLGPSGILLVKDDGILHGVFNPPPSFGSSIDRRSGRHSPRRVALGPRSKQVMGGIASVRCSCQRECGHEAWNRSSKPRRGSDVPRSRAGPRPCLWRYQRVANTRRGELGFSERVEAEASTCNSRCSSGSCGMIKCASAVTPVSTSCT